MSEMLRRDPKIWWVSAFLGSSALHGVALAAYFDVIPWRGWRDPVVPMNAEITVASLIVPEEQLAAAEQPPEPPPQAAPAPEPEPAPQAPAEPPPEPPQEPVVEPEPEPAPPPPPEPEPLPAPEPEPAPPPSPTATDNPVLPAPPKATDNPLLAEEGAGDGPGGGSGGPQLASAAPAPPKPEPVPEPEPAPEPAPAAEAPAEPAPPPEPAPQPEPEPAAVVAPVAVQPAPPTLAEPIVAPPPPSADLEALRRLVSRIRKQFGDSCLIALPQVGAGRAPSVVLLSDRDRSMVDFAAAVLPDPEAPDAYLVSNRAVLVDARQCAAVNFLRARKEYPAFGLSLGLVSAEVLSGGRLIGSIEGEPKGAYTSLLLVDDNGVVQDLRRFLRFSGGKTEFEVPVTRDGDARDTSQVLIALATPDRLATVTNLSGRLAEEFFPALQKELPAKAAIAVLPFDLR